MSVTFEKYRGKIHKRYERRTWIQRIVRGEKRQGKKIKRRKTKKSQHTEIERKTREEKGMDRYIHMRKRKKEE